MLIDTMGNHFLFSFLVVPLPVCRSVLRALCNNPDGLFWAGDTAQTISVGSSFRFNGLKAFQWNIEVRFT